MAKIWETVFQLTSFMKYLMSEVVQEQTECSGYVLNSLYDLLEVTAAWIKRIECDQRLTRNSYRNNINKLIQDEAVLLLQTKKDGIIVNNCTVYNSNNSSHTESRDNVHKSIINYNINFQNSEDNKHRFSEKFNILSLEMHSGRPFGFYCKPCDLVLYNKERWDEHCCFNEEHAFHKSKQENNYSFCRSCNLVIFSSVFDAQQLFDFHCKQHIKRFEVNSVQYNKENAEDEKKSLIKATPDESKEQISGTIRELNKLLPIYSSGKNTIDNMDLRPDEDTNKNLKQETSEDGSTDYKSSANRASLERAGDISASTNSSMLSNSKSTRKNKEEFPKRGKKKSVNEKDETKKTDFIFKYFKDIDSQIHTFNLKKSFYCKPCNKGLVEDWEEHHKEEGHLNAVKNYKGNDIRGICNYCYLTILGTKKNVRTYMDYHTKKHNKVLSYVEERIKSEDARIKKCIKLPKNNVHSFKKEEPSGDVSNSSYNNLKNSDVEGNVSNNNLNIDEYNFEERKEQKTESATTSSNSTVISPKGDSFKDKLCMIIHSRKQQKENGDFCEFLAYCMLCDENFGDAFNWEDHLFLKEELHHRSSPTRKVNISSLNLQFLGKESELLMLKTLVSDNIDFI